MFRSRRASLAVGLVIAVTAAGAASPWTNASAAPSKNEKSALAMTQGFRKAVTVAGIREHQAAFQAFADADPNGNRVASGQANQASIEYVAAKAEAAGLDVHLDEFDFIYNADVTAPELEQLTPVPTTYTDGVHFSSMTYSPNGDVQGAVAAPSGDARGCFAADFAGFPAGGIALVLRGTPDGFPGGSCTFAIKAANAANAGAVATIVYNNVPGVVNGTLGAPPAFTTPVIGMSQALGQEWFAQIGAGLTARVEVNRLNEQRTTYNVIAETPGGDPNNVILVGAHLDSVPRGPGINDNGSGSATILEMAEALEGRDVRNKVRFAWWNAEEFNLLGSQAYVDELKAEAPEELEKIALNLNFDMVGSPNFVRFVYDGDNSAFPVGPGSADGPQGSGLIEQVFHDFFGGTGLASAETPFSGRSDYGPFIAEGIPAGGLFTGAEGVKTAEQAAIFGGTAGVQFDPCYHQACDTFANNSNAALDSMSDAAAHTTLVFARWNFAKNPLTDPEGPVQPHGAITTDGGGGGLHDGHEAVSH